MADPASRRVERMGRKGKRKGRVTRSQTHGARRETRRGSTRISNERGLGGEKEGRARRGKGRAHSRLVEGERKGRVISKLTGQAPGTRGQTRRGGKGMAGPTRAKQLEANARR